MDTSTAVTLELSILQPNPAPQHGGVVQLPPEGGLLTLRHGEFAVRKFHTELQACNDPFCRCASIRFVCKPAGDGSSPTSRQARTFWLDVENRTVIDTAELRKDPESALLVQAITTELADADWRELFRWFRNMKIYGIETHPLEKIDTAALPIVAPGERVGFAEVFPWGRTLEFALGGETWVVDEQYCVQTKCNCMDVALIFLRRSHAAGKTTVPASNLPAVDYNYETGAVRDLGVWPLGAPPQNLLTEALRKAVSSLDLQLKLRHTILKALYARRELAQFEAQLGSLLESSGNQAQSLSRAAKIGRNDPCPCGSGRKYKHCCLAKKD